MAQLYKSALSKVQEVGNQDVDTEAAFKEVISKPVDEQLEYFLVRFTKQFIAQKKDGKEVVKVATEIANEFKAKAGGNNKLKYSGVEFGDICSKFVGENLTFIERKKIFSGFDLDQDGFINPVEFLLHLFSEEVLAGYKERNDVQVVENDSEALMFELGSVALFLDSKLDSNILGLKQLKEKHEATMANIKKEAAEGGGVKKIQLAENLKKEEKSYAESQKQFMPIDQIARKKEIILRGQVQVVNDIKAELKAEDEASRGPSKKK